MDYGKIEYLYDSDGVTKIGEVIHFKTKKDFEKEVNDSIEIGRPIKTKINKEHDLDSELEK